MIITPTQRWLDFADTDLAVARMAAADDRLTSHSAFHAHQVAEKALKAVLVELRIRPPRTHDLPALVGAIRAHGIALGGVDQACLTLDEYGVDVRYPGDALLLSGAQVERAIALAEEVLAASRAALTAVRALPRPEPQLRERAAPPYGARTSSAGLSRSIRSIVAEVVAVAAPRRVVLFGSRATARARPDSDVDLMVELDREADRLSVRHAISAALTPRDFGLDVLVYTPSFMAERRGDPTALLAEIEETGVVMYEASLGWR